MCVAKNSFLYSYIFVRLGITWESENKGTFHQAWRPKFDPWNLARINKLLVKDVLWPLHGVCGTHIYELHTWVHTKKWVDIKPKQQQKDKFHLQDLKSNPSIDCPQKF